MKVNNNQYGYTIQPFQGKIRAEIYKLGKRILEGVGMPHIYLTHKTFGKWYRQPVKEDYEKAKEWADCQMGYIYHANKTKNEKLFDIPPDYPDKPGLQ